MVTLSCHACRQSFQVPHEGDFYCPFCQAVNRFGADPGVTPWEANWRTHPALAFWQTARAALFSTETFFARQALAPTPYPAGVFAIVCQLIGYFAAILIQMGFGLLFFSLSVFSPGNFKSEDLIGQIMSPIFMIGFALVMPVMTVLGLVISTALYHFLLWIFGGARRGLMATYQAVAYSNAAQVWQVIPVLGALVAGIWQIVILYHGFKSLHGISGSRSLLVVLTPVLFFFGILFIAALAAILIIPNLINEVMS